MVLSTIGLGVNPKTQIRTNPQFPRRLGSRELEVELLLRSAGPHRGESCSPALSMIDKNG